MILIRYVGFWIYEVLWSTILALIRQGVLGDKHRIWYLQRRKSNPSKNPKEIISIDIMYHCASLGEYERIKPFIFSPSLSAYRMAVCFFSPSGYNVINSQLNNSFATIYAPIDKKQAVRDFFSQYKPRLIVFSTNPIWPNFLSYLIKMHIPYVYVGASFYPENFVKRWYHYACRNLLNQAHYIHVVDDKNSRLSEEIKGRKECYH